MNGGNGKSQPGLKDMRRHDRTSAELPVVVTDAANRVVGGIRFESADVSPGGAFLRSDLLFEVGEVLRLDFQLPGGHVIRATGRVAHVAREAGDGHTPGMGIEFVALPDVDRKAIEAFLAG